MQSFDHCEKTKYTQRQGRIQEFVQGGGSGPKEINRFHWSRGVPPPIRLFTAYPVVFQDYSFIFQQ